MNEDICYEAIEGNTLQFVGTDLLIKAFEFAIQSNWDEAATPIRNELRERLYRLEDLLD